mmetsp:Transcript_110076/g.321989  ORF Transcript_110076/g.321989 Transcript_110076/m.321989 type:complete len:303 (+) Transcript_110076:314-1222(+)
MCLPLPLRRRVRVALKHVSQRRTQRPVHVRTLDRVLDFDRHPFQVRDFQSPQQNHLVAQAKAGVRLVWLVRRQHHLFHAALVGCLLHLRRAAHHGQAQVPLHKEEVLSGKECSLQPLLAHIMARRIGSTREEGCLNRSSAARCVARALDCKGLRGQPAVAFGVARINKRKLRHRLAEFGLRIVLAISKVAVRVQVILPSHRCFEDKAVAACHLDRCVHLERHLGGATAHLYDSQGRSVTLAIKGALEVVCCHPSQSCLLFTFDDVSPCIAEQVSARRKCPSHLGQNSIRLRLRDGTQTSRGL